MTKVAILGYGKIGSAVHLIIKSVIPGVATFVVDNIDSSLLDECIDFNDVSVTELSRLFIRNNVTHVINCLPFNLNSHVASAAASSNCHYIDFTEDDEQSDRVKEIYSLRKDLVCATKCGLAPGFINYLGANLANRLETTDSLLISVGALPRTVSFKHCDPSRSYNLTWSVDGLVNEYIRPCRIRRNGVKLEIDPLGDLTHIYIDGVEYEAAYTSGGVGSLVDDLSDIPNVAYMTIRYPGHYRYVKEVVQSSYKNFDLIKQAFLKKFPYTNDDVIVVFAEAVGYDSKGNYVREDYSNKFYGTNGLTAIQSTTAAGGVAVLELMLSGKISGIVNHLSVDFNDFLQTQAVKQFYSNKKGA